MAWTLTCGCGNPGRATPPSTLRCSASAATYRSTRALTAQPSIDLFAYTYPLSGTDQHKLTCLLGAIPALLDQAKVNLRDSNAHDLWVFSVGTLRGQSEVLASLKAGTLDMRTLEGTRHADLAGADAALQSAVVRAQQATDAFIAWIESEAPKKTGPSGVGKENYSWYVHKCTWCPTTGISRLRC